MYELVQMNRGLIASPTLEQSVNGQDILRAMNKSRARNLVVFEHRAGRKFLIDPKKLQIKRKPKWRRQIST